jgi:glycosyltransferase involved in cell wall biosynthesis
MYDFILFENWHQATNHLKDVGIIASMLRDCGYTVAVADVYHNIINEDYINDVPVINIQHHVSFIAYPKTGLLSLWPFRKTIGAINMNREARHLKGVMKELEGSYKHLYCGSYYVKMPISWLRLIPSETSVFFWGLRSSRLVQYKRKAYDVEGMRSFFLRRYFNQHQNLKFFVSDQLIYDEFLQLGISPERLVIRPERFIEDYSEPIKKDNSFLSLLSIGSLRPAKRIERIVQAIKVINDQEIFYTIAGCASSEYEAVIEKEIGENRERINRLNYRLSEDDFQSLIKNADFLVLCDRPQASNVTNGTMNEALLAGVPIIAPNYDPYKYFIENYKVGIMYDPGDEHSLVNAILRAKREGNAAFSPSIHKYQSLFLRKNIVAEFSNSLKNVLK